MTKYAQTLAEKHVDWYLKSIRPLLIDNFMHGFKHGQDKPFWYEKPTKEKNEDVWVQWEEE